MKLTLLALAAKYRVQVLQYTPGHLIIQIHQWHLLEQKLPVIQQLIDHDPHILAYSINENIIEIMSLENKIKHSHNASALSFHSQQFYLHSNAEVENIFCANISKIGAIFCFDIAHEKQLTNKL